MATTKNTTAKKTAAAKPAAKKAAPAAEKKTAAKAAPAKKAAAAAKPAAKKAPAAKKPETVAVEFSCYSPASGIVELAGDFNGWIPSRNPMKKDAKGNWSVKVDLKPGRYLYKFVYDGVAWELDQSAPAMADMEGHINSVVDVK